jgi:putative phosphoribosyl transferase
MMLPDDTYEVQLPIGRFKLDGTLSLPSGPIGVVIFAHGSGSSRFSPRNTMVAGDLRRASIATLLFDLLSEEEARDRSNVFDIELLAGRLGAAAHWCRSHRQLAGLPIGYFGASTGAAAALVAAASDPDISAIVSRGGRPDLAGPFLADVTAPTLLIVGSNDTEVVELNENAFQQLRCPKRLELVWGASHLFEEPGTLEHASMLACTWFVDRLSEARLPRRMSGGIHAPNSRK